MGSATIQMPKLGLTMTEGLLAEWRVAPGDAVKSGDVLFVVETDKIATDVEARGDGTIEELKIHAGDTVPVGAVVALWTGPQLGPDGGDDTQAVDTQPAQAASTPAASGHGPQGATSATLAGDRVRATPLARRAARAAGIDLNAVKGSGPGGRIKACDVQAAVDVAAMAPVVSVTHPGSATSVVTPQAGEARKASAFEQVVARRLTESKQTIPHFYVMAEADLTSLLALRGQINGQLSTRISVNHLIVLAVSRAVANNRDFNVVWRDGQIITLPTVDVGIAVETSQGLYAPVIRDLGAKRLEALAIEANEAAARARDNRLVAGDLDGGAITVSNVGMFGASWLIPIINPGQSAIIGVGKTKGEVRPDGNGGFEVRDILRLVLSADHRVHDGAKAARFLNDVVTLLERPLTLLI